MFKSLVILSVFVLSLGCSKNDSQTCVENFVEDCVCTAQYDPVCGCNKKTYGNSCNASCASIDVDYVGECKK